jgi:hypothetical protein
VRGMATDVSVVWLPTSRTAAHQCHHRAGRHATTTDTPTRVRTSTQMSTLTHHRSSDRRRRTCRCGHAVAQLPGGGDLRGATSAPTAEGIARGGGTTTS